MWWDDRWWDMAGIRMMDGLMWGWGLLGMLMMILFWVLLILIVVLIVRSVSRSPGDRSTGGRPPEEDRALSILRERYARGEIGQEEYETRRQTLIRDHSSPE